jgi:transcriptional regulator with XRE-family HTH domain
MSIYGKSIAEEILAGRRKLNLTLKEFVKIFNNTHPISITTTMASISLYERGLYVPRADVYMKIKNILSED